VSLHPASFSEVFYERKVNNIYLDFPGLQNYEDNLDGKSEKLKIRIRWYGETFGRIKKPFLEFKIREGELGRKRIFPLASFILDKNFGETTLRGLFSRSKLPSEVREILKLTKVVILNTFLRKYFVSKDRDYRITLDTAFTFYKLRAIQNSFADKVSDGENIVLELKYKKAQDGEAEEITNNLPFRVTKSSKYVRGVECFFNS